MSLSIIDFRELTFFLFLIYFYFETKIYVALWAALFHIIKAIMRLSLISTPIYKAIIACYILMLLLGYLYKFRKVLFGKEVFINNTKLRNLSLDRVKKKKIIIAILLLLLINVIAITIV